MDADPQPERPEMAEHDLALRRLAEQAHVGDAAVRDEVARAGCVAAVLRALRVAVLCLLDLAADGGDEHVAAKPHAGVLQRRDRLDVAGERALHVRDARARRAVRPGRTPTGWKPGTSRSHGSRPEYEVSMWPLNIRLWPPPAPDQRAERVGAAVLDLLPLDVQPAGLVELDHQLAPSPARRR